MLDNARPITPELVERFRAAYESDPTAKTLTSAASNTPLADIAFDPVNAAKLQMTFSIEIPTTGITNQKQSGRCWLFASMNLMREAVIKKCNLDRFELSGNYFAFWDKFEKINFFLESVIDSADRPVGDRTLDWILQGIGDGGQWDMMVSVVRKYGVVPMSAMPETAQSQSTRGFSQFTNMHLRKDAIELRKLIAEGKDPSARKEEMLSAYFKALCICFGEPVQKFDFEYRDKDKEFHADYGLTPLEFYEKYVGIDLDDYVSVINAPTADKPYGKVYTVQYLGNVIGGGIRYLNLPIEELKALTIKQMQDGELVWFGSDCGKYGDRKRGIWDQDSFRYNEIFGGMDFSLTKEERLDYHDSAMNHAMVLCGVNLDQNGRPNRWKIENSWGEDAGNKGYYIASDLWFEAFTYQVIINKKYLTDAWKQALEEEPIELLPWDPMGTLA